jgi:hypothetical protein
MTIKYNILILIGRAIFIIFITAILIGIIVLVLNGEKFEEWFPVVFFFPLFPFMMTSFLVSIYRETYYVTIDNGKLTLSRPVLGTKKIIEINSIKGFSTSEIKFGARMGKSLFRNDSLVIYSQEFGPIELIRFNYWSFDKIERKFRDLGLNYLGHEEYKTECSSENTPSDTKLLPTQDISHLPLIFYF